MTEPDRAAEALLFAPTEAGSTGHIRSQHARAINNKAVVVPDEEEEDNFYFVPLTQTDQTHGGYRHLFRPPIPALATPTQQQVFDNTAGMSTAHVSLAATKPHKSHHSSSSKKSSPSKASDPKPGSTNENEDLLLDVLTKKKKNSNNLAAGIDSTSNKSPHAKTFELGVVKNPEKARHVEKLPSVKLRYNMTFGRKALSVDAAKALMVAYNSKLSGLELNVANDTANIYYGGTDVVSVETGEIIDDKLVFLVKGALTITNNTAHTAFSVSVKGLVGAQLINPGDTTIWTAGIYDRETMEKVIKEMQKSEYRLKRFNKQLAGGEIKEVGNAKMVVFKYDKSKALFKLLQGSEIKYKTSTDAKNADRKASGKALKSDDPTSFTFFASAVDELRKRAAKVYYEHIAHYVTKLSNITVIVRMVKQGRKPASITDFTTLDEEGKNLAINATFHYATGDMATMDDAEILSRVSKSVASSSASGSMTSFSSFGTAGKKKLDVSSSSSSSSSDDESSDDEDEKPKSAFPVAAAAVASGSNTKKPTTPSGTKTGASGIVGLSNFGITPPRHKGGDSDDSDSDSD